VLILHPGPINRGVELSQDVADGEYSVILDQVTNGVAVRMTVLFLLSMSKTQKIGKKGAKIKRTKTQMTVSQKMLKKEPKVE